MLPVHALRRPTPDTPPTLLVVIDTEEEFDWNAPFDRASTSVANIGYQHLAQSVFAAAGIVPTYAIDYPVATTPSAIDVLAPWRTAGACEIGAHLHPWVNPPDEEAVSARNSFASNLPPRLMRRKLEILRD
ncbi:MAG: WalW protein, partial [Pseudomonadota bacterium]|nr:WalW protein [Pseudomonadota bacterium]